MSELPHPLEHCYYEKDKAALWQKLDHIEEKVEEGKNQAIQTSADVKTALSILDKHDVILMGEGPSNPGLLQDHAVVRDKAFSAWRAIVFVVCCVVTALIAGIVSMAFAFRSFQNSQ